MLVKSISMLRAKECTQNTIFFKFLAVLSYVQFQMILIVFRLTEQIYINHVRYKKKNVSKVNWNIKILSRTMSNFKIVDNLLLFSFCNKIVARAHCFAQYYDSRIVMNWQNTFRINERCVFVKLLLYS